MERESFEAARSMIESSLDSLVSISPEGRITDVNEATVKVTGVPREELIGTAFSDYFTEPEKANAIYQLVFTEGMAVDYPLTIRHRDGTLTEVLYNASVYRNAGGEVLGVFAAARDVTRQRQAGAQYARSLIEAALDPLVTISPEGKITDVNESTVKVTGVPREELIGTDFSSYFTEPDKAHAGYQQAFAKGSVTDYPLTLRHRDGTLIDVLYNVSVYRDPDGDVLGVFAAARDVTEQKRAQAELARQAIDLERLEELERFHRLTVGRELKMIELKKEIDGLRTLVGQDERERRDQP
jgi:PAS domain S-box-containing protein